jgi:5S rRNA maturation endonuclease (ribonuclease M5)
MSVNYFQKVRESVVTEIGMAPQGRRNEALNLAAYALGRHAHMDAANIDSSVIDLHTAAKAIGLQEHEIKATIGSGFKRGSENPKTLENDDAMPFQPSEMDRLIVRLASKDLLIRDEETRAEKIAKAQAAWERSVPISRENKDAVRPALLYLNNRGMRAGVAEGVARFSPSLYDGPAILFPATNEQGELCGVQSVLLTPDGKKREHNNINKYSRGSLVGNAMRIGDQHEGGAIILVEGPEDALSVRQAIMGHVEATIVCTFGKSGMKTFNAPRASDVTICADPDLDVEAVSDVLRGDGSTDVHVVRFDALGVENVKDANDYLQEAGAEKLREALALAKPVEEVKQERIAGERQWPTAYEPIDPATIPARRWIYGQHYVQRPCQRAGVGGRRREDVAADRGGSVHRNGQAAAGRVHTRAVQGVDHQPRRSAGGDAETPCGGDAALRRHRRGNTGALVPRRRQELEHGVRQPRGATGSRSTTKCSTTWRPRLRRTTSAW